MVRSWNKVPSMLMRTPSKQARAIGGDSLSAASRLPCLPIELCGSDRSKPTITVPDACCACRCGEGCGTATCLHRIILTSEVSEGGPIPCRRETVFTLTGLGPGHEDTYPEDHWADQLEPCLPNFQEPAPTATSIAVLAFGAVGTRVTESLHYRRQVCEVIGEANLGKGERRADTFEPRTKYWRLLASSPL